jgi:hypothetical protein
MFSSPIYAVGPVTLNDKSPAMIFTRDLKNIQRDSYGTDRTNAATGEQTGYLSSMQADKSELEGNERHKSVKPMIKVSPYFT